MGEMKLHEDPIMRVMAKGMKLTPRFPAIPIAMGNISAAEATLVVRVSIKMQPA